MHNSTALPNFERICVLKCRTYVSKEPKKSCSHGCLADLLHRRYQKRFQEVDINIIQPNHDDLQKKKITK